MEELIGFGFSIGFVYLWWIGLREWWNGKKDEWRVKNYELGVAKSYSTARSYFQKAADMGNKIACNNVAGYYEDGTGGTKDKYQALKYYKKAYDLGNKDGCANYQRLKNEMGITNDDAVLF